MLPIYGNHHLTCHLTGNGGRMKPTSLRKRKPKWTLRKKRKLRKILDASKRRGAIWGHHQAIILPQCRYGSMSIPIDTFLVGWTSIYQLFWASLGTRVLTHPHVGILVFPILEFLKGSSCHVRWCLQVIGTRLVLREVVRTRPFLLTVALIITANAVRS